MTEGWRFVNTQQNTIILLPIIAGREKRDDWKIEAKSSLVMNGLSYLVIGQRWRETTKTAGVPQSVRKEIKALCDKLTVFTVTTTSPMQNSPPAKFPK